MEQIPLTLENLTQAFRDFTEKKRKQLADEGAALPDGSYPIANRSDLENAIQAFGRAKNKAAAKRHIKKRAKALGLEELLPESWDEEPDSDADAGMWGESFSIEAGAAEPDPMTGLIPGKPLQLFRIGDTVTIDKRKIRITDEDAARLLEDAHGRANDLPIMYQHGDDPVRGYEAGGWIDPRSVTVRDGGIWADRPFWTKEMHEAIKAGKWRYLSPHVYPKPDADEDGFLRPETWLEVSATNTPAIQGMAPVQASAVSATSASSDARITNAPSEVTAKTRERDMTITPETLARLGLADGASPEDVSKAIETMAAKIAELTKPAEVVEVADPVPVTAAPAVDLSAQIAAEAAKLAEKADHERKVAAAVEKAVADGKVTAAQREAAQTFAASNLEGFVKFVEAAPVVAPVAKPDGKMAAKTVQTTKRFSNDHVGDAALSLNADRLALHLAALAYAEENKVNYAQAAIAVSRK